MNWLGLTLLAFIFWGLWGFFPKISSQYLNPKSIFIYEIIGNVIIAIIALFLMKFKVEFHNKGVAFALASGIAAALGTLFFLFAITKGKTSVVVTLTALYPLVTIILSYIFLKEQLGFKEIVGIISALIAIILLAR